jgi:hypothetical protein
MLTGALDSRTSVEVIADKFNSPVEAVEAG